MDKMIVEAIMRMYDKVLRIENGVKEIEKRYAEQEAEREKFKPVNLN